MLNRSASLAMSTSVLKALSGKLDIKRHLPSILYFYVPNFEKVEGAYCFGLVRLCFRVSVPPSVCYKFKIGF